MRVLYSCSIALLSMYLAFNAHALAPVVDESEDYAPFHKEGGHSSPSPQPVQQYASNDEEPLVKSLPKDEANTSISEQINALQQEVQALRGELEVQANAIETLKRQLNNYRDKKLEKSQDTTKKTTEPAKEETSEPIPETKPIENKTKPIPVSKSTSFEQTNSSKNPADEQVAYLAAYDLVKSKRYNEALVSMENFVKQYPQSGYTPNAEYWIGELLLERNMPAQALTHFENVLSLYPTSSKAAAAALKIGYALAAMGHREEAIARLKEVVKNYPDTTAAQLAKTKLDS